MLDLISTAKYLALATLVAFLALQLVFTIVIARLRSQGNTERSRGLLEYVLGRRRLSWVVGGLMIATTGLVFAALGVPVT
jgi:hypothetical protein